MPVTITSTERLTYLRVWWRARKEGLERDEAAERALEVVLARCRGQRLVRRRRKGR